MSKKAATPVSAPPEASTALYEVICDRVEINSLICYRTHRLQLTKEQAAIINENQPDSVRFVGI